MAASKDNLALFEIQTQSCWLYMSVILTLGVSSAGMSQGREKKEQREERHGPSPASPLLSHTHNYFPTTSTVSPSFPSTPSRDFSGECGQQCPRHHRAHSLWGPAEDPELLPSTTAFIPILPTRGEHPEMSSVVACSPFPVPMTGKEKAASSAA